MRSIVQYHRPADLAEAVALLNRPDTNSVVVAGGTSIPDEADIEVVDIQTAVGAGLEPHEGQLVIGAMCRLQDIATSTAAPPLIRELANREGPSTFRNAATIGGTVAAADWESILLAGLLVYEAQLTLTTAAGTSTLALEDALAAPHLPDGAVITSVSIATDGEATFAVTGRTPADTPIVSAAARIVSEGFRIALTGVAAKPTLVDPNDLAALDPPGDFRGSPEYRKALAATLVHRVIARLGGAE
jgi:putative selenate reductase FAD-binding subunit